MGHDLNSPIAPDPAAFGIGDGVGAFQIVAALIGNHPITEAAGLHTKI